MVKVLADNSNIEYPELPSSLLDSLELR